MVRNINPATEELVGEFEIWSREKAMESLELAHHSFHEFKATLLSERKVMVARLGQILKAEREAFSVLMTEEMGKPISESRAEVDKCILACEFYSQVSDHWIGEISMVQAHPKVDVITRPIGVILGIMPWNFPLWQVIRFALPTLMIGNTVMVKHAPNTWGSSMKLANAFDQAGFPSGIYTHLPIAVESVAELIADPRLQGVSLTGSTRAGREVAALAGKSLKRCVLELGGSDPYIVLDDADVELAAEKCVTARMLNGGQSCIAAKRWIVCDGVYEEFLQTAKELMSAYVCADPHDDKTRLGPLARKDLLENVKAQVENAISRGAQVIAAGQCVQTKGFFYPATLLTGFEKSPLPLDEEIFGPVACLYRARDNQHALELANQTSYGLGAAIFSKNEEQALDWARNRMEAGMVAINGMVRSDPRWPFGGIKDSGFGRELTWLGAKEFSNQKVVILD